MNNKDVYTLELAIFNRYTPTYITIDCDELKNIYFNNDDIVRTHLKNIIHKNNDRYELSITKNNNIITFNMNNIDNIINTIINYYKIIHIF
jgi:hypothetical protein